jgi:hypothetical protein
LIILFYRRLTGCPAIPVVSKKGQDSTRVSILFYETGLTFKIG